MDAITRRPAANKTAQIVECVRYDDIIHDESVDPYDWAEEFCEGCHRAVLWPVKAPCIPEDVPNRVAALCRECYREFLAKASETGAKVQEIELATGMLRPRLQLATAEVPS